MVHLIIWVVVALLALSFFGVSLRSVVESPASQDNFSYLFLLLEQGWGYIRDWFDSVADLIIWWQ